MYKPLKRQKYGHTQTIKKEIVLKQMQDAEWELITVTYDTVTDELQQNN